MQQQQISHDQIKDSDSDSKYVILISKDKTKFVIKREYVMISENIKRMLNELTEDKTVEIELPELESSYLESICWYLTYKNTNPKEAIEVIDIPEDKLKTN